MRQAVCAFLMALPVFAVQAETLNLEQSIDRALHSDPRIEEKRHFVDVARATLAEVKGHEGWILDANTFVALAPKVEGNIFKDGVCNPGACQLRDDRYDVKHIAPWVNLKTTLIKPLHTFGKIELRTGGTGQYRQPREQFVHIWMDAGCRVLINDLFVRAEEIAPILVRKIRESPSLIVALNTDRRTRYKHVQRVLEEMKKAESVRV